VAVQEPRSSALGKLKLKPILVGFILVPALAPKISIRADANMITVFEIPVLIRTRLPLGSISRTVRLDAVDAE
jgi:hypothetical protein